MVLKATVFLWGIIGAQKQSEKIATFSMSHEY